jgi:hypothetical protein
MVRKALITLAAVIAGMLAFVTPAFAGVTVNGVVVPPEGYVAIAGSGTCTTFPSTTSTLSGLTAWESYNVGVFYQASATNVLELHYRLSATCGSVHPVYSVQVRSGVTYAWNDTAGTLTLTEAVPASMAGDYDDGTGAVQYTLDLTSGTGNLTVIYQSDNPTEKSKLTQAHTAFTKAKTVNAQAVALNNALVALS